LRVASPSFPVTVRFPPPKLHKASECRIGRAGAEGPASSLFHMKRTTMDFALVAVF
jgi:hypothetical protein